MSNPMETYRNNRTEAELLGHVPPAVMELFKLLPPPGSEFPADARMQFMKALACVFYLTHGPAEPLKIEASRPTESI